MSKSMRKKISHCHKLVAETAQAMAHELYDTMMQDNVWYDCWKEKNPGATGKAMEARFVNANWGKLVENARATLAQMLAGGLDESLKEEIMEALCLDHTLIRGRKNPSFVMN